MSNESMTKAITLDQVLEGLETDNMIPDLTVTGMSSNSNELKQGDVFVALKGHTHHGIDFALHADDSEASIVLYDSNDEYVKNKLMPLTMQLAAPTLGIADLNEKAGIVFNQYNLLKNKPSEAEELEFDDEDTTEIRALKQLLQQTTLIGVTGTDGKTSVTHLLVQAFTRLELLVGSIGTLGAGIGNDLVETGYTTPTAELIQKHLAEFHEQDCDLIVMEVSSHALEQNRAIGCNFKVAVLTNLGSDHLDYHKTLDEYASAKEKLFQWQSLSKRVLNGDDEFGQELASKYDPLSIVSFSSDAQHKNAQVRLLSVRALDKGIELSIQMGDEVATFESQLIGDFNVANILAVVSVLYSLKYNASQVVEACHLFEPIAGRMQVIDSDSDKQVIVDFAHTEQALTASLEAAKKQSKGELWCVFGCGGDRDDTKRARMGAAAEEIADHVVVTDDNPRTESPSIITKHILIGCKDAESIQVIHNRKDAIEFAISQAKANDTVLIAGKGHESFQIIGEEKLPFSDVEVAADCLRDDA